MLSQVVTHTKLVVTEEGKGYLAQGSPEAQVFNALPAGGAVPLAELKVMRWLGWLIWYGFLSDREEYTIPATQTT